MVLREKHIEKNVRVVAQTQAGPLIEIEFKGKASDSCGGELLDFVDEAVQDMKPAGVLVNLDTFKIRSWDDIAPVFTRLLDSQTCKFLPFCIVARRKTAKSLTKLFEVMQVADFQNAEFFDDARSGLKYLEKKFEGTRRPAVPAQPTGPGSH